jgi:DNA-binding NtrC family response regulator
METMSEGKKKKMSEKALNRLLSYSFPGNIRELENIVVRAICRARGQEIREEDIALEPIEENLIMTKAEKLYWDMRQGGKAFWEVVYKPFLERDLERNAVKQIIAMGLKESGGSYKKILPLFNMSSDEKGYKRFMKFLRVHRLQH